jgi:hypothetical protein
MSHTFKQTARIFALGALIAAPATAQVPAAATLPSGLELHNLSIKAVGGEDVIRKHGSVHFTGKFEVPAAGMTGSVEAWNSEGKVLTIVELPGIGTIRTGFDGEVGWQMHPAQGPMLLTGKQLEQMKQQADLLAALTPDKYVKARETVEKTSFGGKDAYKVKITQHNGEEYFEFYDISTSLSLGSIRKTETPMGAIDATTIITEYKTFDGQQVATQMKQAAMGVEQVVTMTKFEFVPIEKTTFDLPKEIKALTGK